MTDDSLEDAEKLITRAEQFLALAEGAIGTLPE